MMGSFDCIKRGEGTIMQPMNIKDGGDSYDGSYHRKH